MICIKAPACAGCQARRVLQNPASAAAHAGTLKIARGVLAITGASRGLGQALVVEGLAAGWEIVACVRDVGRALPKLRRDPRVHTVECDLRSPAEVHKLAERLKTEFPTLRGLVNNAGVQYSYPVLEGANYSQELEDEIERRLARLSSSE